MSEVRSTPYNLDEHVNMADATVNNFKTQPAKTTTDAETKPIEKEQHKTPAKEEDKKESERKPNKPDKEDTAPEGCMGAFWKNIRELLSVGDKALALEKKIQVQVQGSQNTGNYQVSGYQNTGNYQVSGDQNTSNYA